MKNLVNNWFDNIEAVITNSEENIDIDIINMSKKTYESIFSSTLLCTTLGFHEKENHNIPKLENEVDIKWEKTDDKNPPDDNITPTELLSSSTP